MKYKLLIISFIVICSCKNNKQENKQVNSETANKTVKLKILFDASKAEMCGNADWVIDADKHDMGFSSKGKAVEGKGIESNPDRFPTPAQENIDANTPEDYWNGALSGWGIDCVKEGFKVETLPVKGRITYGDTSNDQDLSNYKIFVVDEPNIKFEEQEKSAIRSFVENGGGLFMISDHSKSDRNHDHWDSPMIWNNLDSTSTFPIYFDLGRKITQISNHFSKENHPVLDGKFGRPKRIGISAGTTMYLGEGAQALCIAKQSKDKYHKVLVAVCNFGKGKIVAMSDSSPADDGTGDINDRLHKNYFLEFNGEERKLLMNAILWLAY